ncbi:MAG TPA: glycosyltransferase [Gemmatimonadales bacterium]|nr:glycosyltransferase [Gemmatimonadales bacterium]
MTAKADSQDALTLVVSIDTEEDNWDPVRERLTVENIRELPRLDRMFERLGVRATYFTTYEVASTPWCLDILRGLSASGRAEIAAHLHPWNTPPVQLQLTPRNTMLGNLPIDLQRAKIETLTQLLSAGVGRHPHSFRAGRWGLTHVTAAALIEAGYRVDSSVTPFRSWRADGGFSHIGAPINVYRLDGRSDHRVPVQAGELIEVPVSWGYTHGSWRVLSRIDDLVSRSVPRRFGLDRAMEMLHVVNHVVLSPEIEALDDMERLARKLIARGARHLHMTFHSPSLVPGLSPFASTAKEVDLLYARLSGLIERISKTTPVRFATVGEAGVLLAPRRVESLQMPAAKVTRKLVVVSYHFPPDPAIGGLRWSGLTKYLAPLGWRSWVVTTARNEQPPPGVTIVHRPRRRTLNDLYRRFNEWRRRRAAAAVVPSEPGAPVRASAGRRRSGGWLASFRYEGGVLLSLPDEGRGWILRAASATRTLLARERPDVIVSSGPPHSAHLAAWLATRFRKVTWFVDLRDPWAGPLSDAWRDTPFFKSRIARWFTTRFERLALRSATAVICNTREFTEALTRRYPDLHIQWVPNAVDRSLLPPPLADRYPGLSLAHVGTLYGGRNLGPVLRGMRRLFDRNPDAANDGAMLRIAGHVEEPYLSDLRRQVRDLGLGRWVEFLGTLPRGEALGLMSRSRVGLVLAQGQEFQVPAKLYELVSMGVHTLVLAPADSAAGSEAKRVGATAIDPEDTEAIAAFLGGVRDGTLPALNGESVDYKTLAPRVARVLIHPLPPGAMPSEEFA